MFKKVINYIKDFIDKCMFYYKKDEAYKKSSKKILLFFLVIDIIFLFVGYFIGKLDKFDYFIVSIVIFFVWLIIQVLYSFFVIPSDYIEPNMDKLPRTIGKYPVVIQYAPPKGLNPSEVGMLYNKDYESTNVSCMVYKWENEGLIRMEDKGNGSYILYRNGDICNDVPGYERLYWNIIFGRDRKSSFHFNLNDSHVNLKDSYLNYAQQILYELQHPVALLQNVTWNDASPTPLVEGGYVHIELLKYCKEKGWLIEENDFKWLWIWGIVFLINPMLWFFWTFMYFVYKGQKKGDHVLNPFKKFLTTDKGDELLAQIIGYKYWLERCEEQQIKKILEDDPSFISRTFPYIVALRMNWRLLDKSLDN